MYGPLLTETSLRGAYLYSGIPSDVYYYYYLFIILESIRVDMELVIT